VKDLLWKKRRGTFSRGGKMGGGPEKRRELHPGKNRLIP